MRNILIVSAVAAALTASVAGANEAADQAAAQAAVNKVVISGSSAAEAAVQSFLNSASWCNGALVVFNHASGTPDFNAWYCAAPVAAAGVTFAGIPTTVLYRGEGGSAVGVLPEYNHVALNHIDLSAASTL